MQRALALLFLGWAGLLFVSALGLFASGFLLTRIELDNHSACLDPPGEPGPPPPGSCWLPARFPKVVLLVIDALKFEFAWFRPAVQAPRPYENKMEFLHLLTRQQPTHSRLYRFRADPPTTTMQRIKGITTGTLPTFIDAGSNFASYAIREDNLIWQLAQNGRKVVFMGDDTWDGLFPRAFYRSYFFPSFNVKDLHTVDDGILQHLYQTMDDGEWDLLIAHFLGVDHCGHKHGPDHPEMAKKLSQMDDMLRLLVDHLADDTLLLVAGDHGMTGTGDHGGDSEEEVDAALFVYSKTPLFQDLPTEESEIVPQVNLVPTLALLMGVPVPYNNIGEVMADLVAGEGDAASVLRAQLAAYSINARQVARFLHSYAQVAQDIPVEKLQHLEHLFAAAAEEHQRLLVQTGPPILAEMEALRSRFQQYLREARDMCAESWARFRPIRMGAGCALLISSCLLCYIASKMASGLPFSYHHFLFYPLLWGLTGAALLGLAHFCGWTKTDLLLLSAGWAAASQFGFFWQCWTRRSLTLRTASTGTWLGGLSLKQRLRAGLDSVFPLGILLLRCGAMFSDSFVMAEAQVAPFLLVSLMLLVLLKLQWKGRLDGSPCCVRLLAALAVVLICTRLSGLFWRCREETPACQSAPILAPLSTVQEPRAKSFYYSLCLAVLVSMAGGTRWWLCHYGNLNSPCAPILFVRWGFPLLASGIASYWAITSGAEEAMIWLHAWVQLALVAFPRGIFCLVIAGLLLVFWKPVTVFVKSSQDPLVTGMPIASPNSKAELLHMIPQLYRRMQESLKSRLEGAEDGSRATVLAYGLGSVYSAALLISLALLGFMLITLHMERLSLAFLLLFLEAFALLWVHVCAQALSASSSQADPLVVPWDTLIAWALATGQFFYATGHQPVFPAIHWNAAFVGFPEGHESNLLPALLVGSNTFASHILLAAGCPLLLLWPFLCEIPISRGKRPKNRVQGLEEQMMEMRLREVPEQFSAALLQLGLKYLLVLGLQLLASVLAAVILRRHLMVWKVFAPKFLFEALGFVVSWVFLLLSLGLVMRVDCAVSVWFQQVILAQSR